MYSKENLPPLHSLVMVTISIVTKNCGNEQVGYFIGATDTHILLSDLPHGGGLCKIGWDLVKRVESTPSRPVCLDL
jgi:hypothetical protein